MLKRDAPDLKGSRGRNGPLPPTWRDRVARLHGARVALRHSKRSSKRRRPAKRVDDGGERALRVIEHRPRKPSREDLGDRGQQFWRRPEPLAFCAQFGKSLMKPGLVNHFAGNGAEKLDAPGATCLKFGEPVSGVLARETDLDRTVGAGAHEIDAGSALHMPPLSVGLSSGGRAIALIIKVWQIDEVVRRHRAAGLFENLDEGFLVRHSLAGRVTAYSRLAFANTITEILVAETGGVEVFGEFHAGQIP